jgi:hypothetical protein
MSLLTHQSAQKAIRWIGVSKPSINHFSLYIDMEILLLVGRLSVDISINKMPPL